MGTDPGVDPGTEFGVELGIEFGMELGIELGEEELCLLRREWDGPDRAAGVNKDSE